MKQWQSHKAHVTAKRTENPNFGTPLRASCLALESAEREHTKFLDLSLFLWAKLREGKFLGMCRWRVLRTVEFPSEMFWAVFRRKSGLFFFNNLFLPKLSPTNSAANFSGNFRRETSPGNFPANFDWRISPANFARHISPSNI